MINIIKSLNYSARRSNLNWIAIISMMGLPAFVMYIAGMLGDSLSKPTPSAYFASQQMGTCFIFISFGIMMLSSSLVAGDAGDKTINYEIMAGHSRGRVFAGRMLSGYLWGALIPFIIMLFPLGYLNILFGWGPETDVKNVLIRSVLVIFPIIRLCALNMMLASISRSAGKGIALGFAVFMITAIVTSVIQGLLGIDIIYPTGFTNASFLLVSENSRNVVIGGRTVSVFDTAVTDGMIWKTIAFSLVFSAVYLIIAYVDFMKRDWD